MHTFEQLRDALSALVGRIAALREHLGIEAQQRQLVELEQRAADPNLWQDQDRALQVAQDRAAAARAVEGFVQLEKMIHDTAELMPLAADDADIATELGQAATQAEREVAQLELQRLLGGPYDQNHAIVSINAGAGGTESQDWASMLLRMLLRWAERRGFAREIYDTQGGEEAGLKSVSLGIMGPFAYGYLKGEAGVHRLVRISPYDAQKRRHTSFASVAVAPEVDETVAIDIRDDELRVDTYRAQGAGGQHVNKTDSAVRLTHLPTGIVVACQAERSQHKNRAKALKMLRARLFELELRRMAEEKAKLAGTKKKIEWGSQIRSYVLQPYRLVKDHRTGHTSSQADAVLDGEADLDAFMRAFLSGETAGQEADLEE